MDAEAELERSGVSPESSQHENPQEGSAPSATKMQDREDGLSNIAGDQEFWFEDGTIVLVAKDVQFRVYEGLLADHSPVLRDLFAKPGHPVRSFRSRVEKPKVRCPIVTLSDSPEDLRHMLRMYMPRRNIRYA